MNFRKKLSRAWRLTRIFPCRLRLIAFLFLNRRLPVDLLFQQAWRLVDDSTSLEDRKKNIQQISVLHFLHHELRQLFYLLFPNFSPPIVLMNWAVIDNLRAQQSIITTMHSRSEYALLAALDRAGLATSFISHRPIHEERLAKYRFQISPTNILQTRSVFLDARSAMNSGRIVVCDVDFVIAQGTADMKHYVSTAAFEFCSSVKGKLFFAHTRIGNEGQIECIIESADFNASSSGRSTQAGASFIAFIDRVQDYPSGLSIAN